MVGIIDYGAGNLGSIQNMLKKIGESSCRICQPQELAKADRLILPGVGAFDFGMSQLRESGMQEALRTEILVKKKPLLGICLGMQMLGMGSTEGKLPGLGYLDFHCERFPAGNPNLRVPHMGWDRVKLHDLENPLTKNLPEKPRFYFVHSYYAICQQPEDVLLTCNYGVEFAAAVHRENVWGTQFHPEKSHQFGMALLRSFVKEC